MKSDLHPLAEQIMDVNPPPHIKLCPEHVSLVFLHMFFGMRFTCTHTRFKGSQKRAFYFTFLVFRSAFITLRPEPWPFENGAFLLVESSKLGPSAKKPTRRWW
jgi:hypothetical protein